KDGTRFLWGTVTALEPPSRVAFSWHPTQHESDAQQIEITFTPDRAAGGTRVELVSTGWEKMSEQARRARNGYAMGWGAVLDRLAGRFNPAYLLFNAMSAGITLIGQRGTFVRKSLGRMPAESR